MATIRPASTSPAYVPCTITCPMAVLNGANGLRLRWTKPSTRRRRDAWRGSTMKERAVENAIRATLGDRPELMDAIFEIVKAQSEY